MTSSPSSAGPDARPPAAPASAGVGGVVAGPAATAPSPTATPAAPGPSLGPSEKGYRPADHEPAVAARWLAADAWRADPSRVLDGRAKPYAVFIPPPNVTGRLHMGHALNNTLQDILARAHRMMGDEVLWMPGTDHAGIATQTVVEKRVLKEEGKRRGDFARDDFIAKIQAYKDEYEATITGQLKAMGCSCDWSRQRFTMDPLCSRAVREAFFRLFKDGLLYRGKRLVNWDPVTQTALADDEVEDLEVDGAFYYLRYPLVHADGSAVSWKLLASLGFPQHESCVPAGSDTSAHAFIVVATTRPETYLGDTAVAVNPRDPRAAALRGMRVRLPLVGRIIPIIEDEYVVLPGVGTRYCPPGTPQPKEPDAKAAFATGFLKVTPAHDFNDYELGVKHKLPMINVMAPDGSISGLHGWEDHGDAVQFIGMARELARREVVNQFTRHRLLHEQRPYKHVVGHSYRSLAPIEPYLSDQWYVRVTDDRLAGATLRALDRTQSQLDHPTHRHEHPVTSPAAGAAPTSLGGAGGASTGGPASASDGQVRFVPDRYARTYQTWNQNIRDWCVSRQLWWGHRIPVWSLVPDVLSTKKGEQIEDSRFVEDIFLSNVGETLLAFASAAGIAEEFCVQQETRTMWRVCARTERAGAVLSAAEKLVASKLLGDAAEADRAAATLGPAAEHARKLATMVTVLEQDPDVLDTWFSSALWPLSTLGWPAVTPELRAFNPSAVLCTAREIITLWVSRMVMFNRYFLPESWPANTTVNVIGHAAPLASALALAGEGHGRGPVPFRDVYIHAVVQDGDGRKMSKSLGNGVDPLDIIASHGSDAMRFTLCHMATQTQDVRMPVLRDERTGRNTSPKFDLGRNLCNKLWNAATGVALPRLAAGGAESPPSAVGPALTPPSELLPVDRWMLSRTARAAAAAKLALEHYDFAGYADTLYDLLWRDFCDVYIEAVKPTIAHRPGQRAALRAVLAIILRLMHPVCPFITEVLHAKLLEAAAAGKVADLPGVRLHDQALLARSGWPELAESLISDVAEAPIARAIELVGVINQARATHAVAPKRRIVLHAPPAVHASIHAAGGLVETLAGLAAVTEDPPSPGGPAVAVTFGSDELRLSSLAELLDAATEIKRLVDTLLDRQREVLKLRARLASPGYVDRAPANLVKQTRDQLDAKESERAAALAALAPAKAQAVEQIRTRHQQLAAEVAALSAQIPEPPPKQLTPDQKKAKEALAARADDLTAAATVLEHWS